MLAGAKCQIKVHLFCKHTLQYDNHKYFIQTCTIDQTSETRVSCQLDEMLIYIFQNLVLQPAYNRPIN